MVPQFARLNELARNYEVKILDAHAHAHAHPVLSAYADATLACPSAEAVLGGDTDFSGLLHDLYRYRNIYLAPIGRSNGVKRIDAVDIITNL